MIIKNDEASIISQLSALYKARGFRSYKLGCFEEYSLYQDNRDFLISKNVITFSDLDGRLMAIRPDVTLSVVRHNDVPAGSIEKFYYNEKVYRQAAGSKNYAEISQTGVEVIGDIDIASTVELIVLICDTLNVISDEYVLDVSHMGFTEGLLESFGANKELFSQYLNTKNYHDFYTLAESNKYSSKQMEAFRLAVSVTGDNTEILNKAESLCLNSKMSDAVAELKTIIDILNRYGYADKIKINFSSAANADYYNGVTFNGYVKDIPHSVLSGGRYDKLLQKLDKKGGAIGFALYLGEIERYFEKRQNAVDAVIVYDTNSQLKALEMATSLINEGKSVRISSSVPENLKYSQLIDLTKSEVCR